MASQVRWPGDLLRNRWVEGIPRAIAECLVTFVLLPSPPEEIMSSVHVQEELVSSDGVAVQTRYGFVKGGKASNGSNVFLEVPYALRPRRFEDPEPLPSEYDYKFKKCIVESACLCSFEDKVGLGAPTENPFLQFGSPHSLSSQAQYVAAERSEVWVNIGYRLSAFGFLASDKHSLTGNYGFKDQWLALEWIKENIGYFGGDPKNIQITGLSAGAHSVHQILHHAANLPECIPAPFTSAVLQSNAILMDPKSPKEFRPQFEALCRALGLDPDAEDVVQTLKDPAKVPWNAITKVIEEEKLGPYGTFRGCLSSDWIKVSPGPMERQRDGSFAAALKEHGVKFVVVGEVIDEWYLYSIAHPISSTDDFVPNLERYFSPQFVAEVMQFDREGEDVERRFGELLSLLQVHLPVRILARDLVAGGFPVLRYQIRWTPEQGRPLGEHPRFWLYSEPQTNRAVYVPGYVTHGTDRPLWALRLPSLTEKQQVIARKWLDAIDEESYKMEKGDWISQGADKMLVLDADMTIRWEVEEAEARERYEEIARALRL
ncbi:hypothetical protein NMY22_g2360 [Coprinellus aureogranulatus]|nr:hypothetical protein NMY22_g2360 [Coprinellus aureogranulatus]